jgi:UDP-N-acetyl-D-glucosamine dehydrogenase
VDPGNAVWTTKNTPKVLGGLTPACLEAAQAFYGRIFDTIVPVESAEAAELVKLYENTFRMINIALVNELAQVCDRLDVDVWDVLDAAATKPFGFMKFTPGPRARRPLHPPGPALPRLEDAHAGLQARA